MDLPVNHFKHALRQGKPQIGLWNSLNSYVTTEVIAGAGYDWILIDTEHSPNDIAGLHQQLQAMMENPLSTPVVRPPWNDMVTIKRYLDVGCQSLLIPYVQNADEAADAVRFTRYPPHGVRGISGSSRSSRFGRVKNYLAQASKELCLLVQTETIEAIGQIEKMAAVDGVDGIFIGPGDLSASMGYLGQLSHPEVLKVIDDAVVRIKKTGKAAGILTPDETLAKRWLALGATFVAVGMDTGLLARGAEALRAKFK
ncbi:MAG: HpcH/HpaI aldolase/citrate lyase family protein [Burkholderiales bacterium]